MTVDNCFHYLWGGGYVIEAAKRGYICYTNCTSTLAEVAHPAPSLLLAQRSHIETLMIWELSSRKLTTQNDLQ